MMPQITIPKKEWPEEIRVEPSRLAMGIWGEPEGDIQAAYSADTIPKIKTFAHEGHLFTNCGGRCEEAMNCYPLIPEALYQGPGPAKYTYEGMNAVHRGQNVRLGPCVKFVVRERTQAEWAHLLRRKYAHGGMFAAGKSYAEMLGDFLEKYGLREGEKAAIENELAGADLPSSQQEMLERLSSENVAAVPAKDHSQLTLPGL
jgi:hypothetical protein